MCHNMAEGGAADDEYLYSDDLFLEKPPENYSCPICLCPVQRVPHLTSCCGNHFCLQCIRRVKNQGIACPMCNATPFEIFPNKERQREINQLRVRCPCRNKHPRCSWTGELGKIDSHVGEHNGRSGTDQLVSHDTSTRETSTSYHQPHCNESAVASDWEHSGTEDAGRCVSTSSAVSQQNTYRESQSSGNGCNTTQSSRTTFFLTPLAQHHPVQPVRLHFHQPLLHHGVPSHVPHPPPHHRPHPPPHHVPHHPPHHMPHFLPHHRPHHPSHHMPHPPPHHRPHHPPHHMPHPPPHHVPHPPPHHVPHHPPHHMPHFLPHHRPHAH